MKLKSILWFCLIGSKVFAQGIDNLWLMGYRGGGGGINLDFTGDTLNITSQANRIMNFDATNGEICDRNGNLLFSSNGVFIANAFNDTMLNGSRLNPSYYTDSISGGDGLNVPQANFIISIPGDSTKYYLFHETDDDWDRTDDSFYFYYSIIDMTQDSGKGAVIEKNVVLTTDSFTGLFLTGCKHANGRDWWVINHQANTDKYFKYLITPNTIVGPDTQSIGSIRSSEYFGQIAFSPDGSKAAIYDPIYNLDIMDFDRCSGIFSNMTHIDFNDGAVLGGVAFSANSKVLYVSSNTYVFQFDLASSNIPSTEDTVAIYDGYAEDSIFATDFGPIQLAPDGKIYIVPGNGTHYIHVINYPDSVGLGCDVCQHCVHLPAFNYLTIANHPNYFLGADSGSMCDSLEGVQSFSVQNSTVQLYPNPTTGMVTVIYNLTTATGELQLFDLLGRMVNSYQLDGRRNQFDFDAAYLCCGVFQYRIIDYETIKAQGKLIIIK